MLDQAEREASAAADAANVVIAAVSEPADLDVLRTVMDAVWGQEVVPPRNLLRGLALAGSALLLARRDGRPIGFAYGWVGWDGGVHFHSHQTGVAPGERSSGVGFALKLAQRAGVSPRRRRRDAVDLRPAARRQRRVQPPPPRRVGRAASCPIATASARMRSTPATSPTG